MRRGAHLEEMRRRPRRGIATVVLTLVMTAAACGDGSSDDGSAAFPGAGGASGGGVAKPGSSGTTGGQSGSGGGVSGSSSGTGSGADGGASGDGSAASSAARALFEALLPSLSSTCGGSCHGLGAGGAPIWLGQPDPYASATKFPGIIGADPGTSIIVTKGRHEGPAMADPLLTQVMGWLTAEAAALPVVTLPSTSAFTPTMGSNDIDCSAAGIPGLHVTFNATASGNLLTLEGLSVVTPMTTGAQITYPIFAILPQGGPEIDDASLSNLVQTVAAGSTATLGPGLLVLTQWSTGAQMKIEFTALVKATVADGGGATTGGCKSVASFTQNAVPAIQANTCLSCHNTGGSGNPSLDLSGLAANPPDDATACAQALSRVNLQTPAQSDIILAPTGQVANHPFKNASQSFVTMMETWIAAEK
jgi:cytochrome c553